MRSEPNLPARQGHKRVETAGTLLCARAASAQRSRRPQAAHSPLRFSEKRPARSGEPPARLVPPHNRCRKELPPG